MYRYLDDQGFHRLQRGTCTTDCRELQCKHPLLEVRRHTNVEKLVLTLTTVDKISASNSYSIPTYILSQITRISEDFGKNLQNYLLTLNTCIHAYNRCAINRASWNIALDSEAAVTRAHFCELEQLVAHPYPYSIAYRCDFPPPTLCLFIILMQALSPFAHSPQPTAILTSNPCCIPSNLRVTSPTSTPQTANLPMHCWLLSPLPVSHISPLCARASRPALYWPTPSPSVDEATRPEVGLGLLDVPAQRRDLPRRVVVERRYVEYELAQASDAKDQHRQERTEVQRLHQYGHREGSALQLKAEPNQHHRRQSSDILLKPLHCRQFNTLNSPYKISISGRLSAWPPTHASGVV